VSSDPFEPAPEPEEPPTPLSDELEQLTLDLDALRHSGHPQATRYADWDDVEQRMRSLTEAVFALETRPTRSATNTAEYNPEPGPAD
jgi:hypothetical protein